LNAAETAEVFELGRAKSTSKKAFSVENVQTEENFQMESSMSVK
jgi:hypothetical protein